MKQAGDFVAETDTRTETTGEALRLTVEEFAKLQRQRVYERELADAQAYLAGSFPLTIETPNDIATQVLNAMFYELPLEEIGTFRERVLAVTPDDIQRVARQYIKPDRLSIVLVGNAQGVRVAVARGGLHRLRNHPHRTARSHVRDVEERAAAARCRHSGRFTPSLITSARRCES